MTNHTSTPDAPQNPQKTTTGAAALTANANATAAAAFGAVVDAAAKAGTNARAQRHASAAALRLLLDRRVCLSVSQSAALCGIAHDCSGSPVVRAILSKAIRAHAEFAGRSDSLAMNTARYWALSAASVSGVGLSIHHTSAHKANAQRAARAADLRATDPNASTSTAAPESVASAPDFASAVSDLLADLRDD